MAFWTYASTISGLTFGLGMGIGLLITLSDDYFRETVYGERSKEEVRVYSWSLFGFLIIGGMGLIGPIFGQIYGLVGEEINTESYVYIIVLFFGILLSLAAILLGRSNKEIAGKLIMNIMTVVAFGIVLPVISLQN
jgi:hypothetical protein